MNRGNIDLDQTFKATLSALGAAGQITSRDAGKY